MSDKRGEHHVGDEEERTRRGPEDGEEKLCTSQRHAQNCSEAEV